MSIRSHPPVALQRPQVVPINYARDLFKRLGTCSERDQELACLHQLGQVAAALDEWTLRYLTDRYLNDSDPRFRGAMCYALGQSGRYEFLPRVQGLVDDPARWVAEQARRAVHLLIQGQRVDIVAVRQRMNEALDDLRGFIERSGDALSDEHRRHQVLAKTRNIVRRRVFCHFDEDSEERGLATAIINAANRIEPKHLRRKHLSILDDALRLLRDGAAEKPEVDKAKRRLLEIDAPR
jgi:hypothetical protein